MKKLAALLRTPAPALCISTAMDQIIVPATLEEASVSTVRITPPAYTANVIDEVAGWESDHQK